VATLHPVSLAFLVVVSAILVVRALREERSFEGTPFAADYLSYRRTAGLLWPKLGVGGGR
jgi:protein-S-isoprenylcysteine O-methyltransferase Ste14